MDYSYLVTKFVFFTNFCHHTKTENKRKRHQKKSKEKSCTKSSSEEDVAVTGKATSGGDDRQG